MSWAVEMKDYSQRRVCALVGIAPARLPSRSDDATLRQCLRELSSERRRFGYRRLLMMLRGEGHVVNHKKLFRLYREEKLTVRRRGGPKRAIGTRAPMLVPTRPDERWSLDFVSDQLTDGRRFRILAVIDDCTRECLALVADTSLSGLRVARELDQLIAERGRPKIIVSDNASERKEIDWAGKVSLFVSMLRLRDAGQVISSNQVASTGNGKGLVHSKHRVRALAALTVLNTSF